MAKRGTLKYRKITRTPQSGENANKKMWYATTVTDREVSFEDFVTHVSEHNSPYSRGTVHGVLMDTLDCLQELILDGKSVRFADLGLFSIGMTSKGVESKDKVFCCQCRGRSPHPAQYQVLEQHRTSQEVSYRGVQRLRKHRRYR